MIKALRKPKPIARARRGDYSEALIAAVSSMAQHSQAPSQAPCAPLEGSSASSASSAHPGDAGTSRLELILFQPSAGQVAPSLGLEGVVPPYHFAA